MGGEFDPDEDEPVPNEDWPLCSLAYSLLNQLLQSSNGGGDFDAQAAGQMPACLSLEFSTRLMRRLDSEDPREREAVQACLHRIYTRMIPQRPALRQAIADILDEHQHHQYDHGDGSCSFHYMGELLELLASIVEGFAKPLKAEHAVFFREHVLPLHRVKRGTTAFFAGTALATLRFVEKKAGELGPLVLDYLLRAWPRESAARQVFFLGECDEVLRILWSAGINEQRPLGEREVWWWEGRERGALVRRFFKQIAECCSSPHFQVPPP